MQKTVTPIFLVMLIFLSFGCNADVKNDNEEKVDSNSIEQFMSRPEIILATGHSYRDGDSWLGESIEVTSERIKIAGKSIFIELVFENKIEMQDLKEKIQLIGCDNYEIEYRDRNTVRLNARDIQNGKSYLLKVLKSIEDIDGNTLMSDINIEIILDEDPKAFYKYVGHKATIDNLGQTTSDIGSVHDTLPVTGENLKFVASFTMAVDKDSVEKSITKALDNQGKIHFNWIDERNLEIILEGLAPNHEYLISMKEATDVNGNKIIGNLFFTVQETTKIGYIESDTKIVKVLKEFVDTPYLLFPSNSIEHYFIVGDIRSKYILNTKNDTLIELDSTQYSFGFPQYEWYSNWLNDHTVIGYNEENHSILTHNFTNNVIKKLFTIPSEIMKFSVYDVMLSPKKDKIAITISGPDMSLYLFSLEGKLLYNGNGVANTYTRNNGTQSIYLQWLNEHTFIFGENTDIFKLDILTGKKEILLKDAEEPVVYPNSDLMVVKKHIDRQDVYYMVNISTGEEFVLGISIDNILFMNDNSLLYNEEENIVLFDLSLKEKEVIGKGYIRGVSPDHSKIFFVSNDYTESRYYY